MGSRLKNIGVQKCRGNTVTNKTLTPSLMIDPHFTASGFLRKASQQTGKASQQTGKASQQTGKVSQYPFAVK